MTIVEFIRARLDEDQEIAEAATRPPWRSGNAYPNLAEGEPGADEVIQYYVGGRPTRLEPADNEAGFELIDTNDWGQAGAWAAVAEWDADQPNFRDASDDADHIARHDPARVLAQVAVMRAIVDLHDQADECGPTTMEAVRHLAEIWSSHPDYDPAWAPS